MITLEKMLVLKTIPLFRYIPDDILLIVASVIKEHSVDAGQLIIKKDDLDASMYIIVRGKVKVHDDAKVITELGEREVFGELAALMPEKRIASVSAVEETLLLKITHEELYQLMDMHTGLAKGIIHVLCQKIRTIAAQKKS